MKWYIKLISPFFKTYMGVDYETSNWGEPRQVTIVYAKKIFGITYIIKTKQEKINEAYYKDFLTYLRKTL